ncbi:transporter substrate-binding protein [Pseudomonas aeruginosa]
MAFSVGEGRTARHRHQAAGRQPRGMELLRVGEQSGQREVRRRLESLRKAKNLPNYGTAVTNDPMEATYVGITHVGAGRGKAGSTEVDKVREAMAGQSFRRHPAYTPGHGQEQPPPAQAGDDRRDRDDGQFEVVWKTPRAASRATLSPFIPGQREEAGACAEEQLSSAVKNPAP